MSLTTRTDVTAVKFHRNYIFAGIGSYVNIFEKETGKLLQRLQGLKGQKIYSFVVSKCEGKILVFGGKQFTMLNERGSQQGELFSRCFEPVLCDDWLHSAVWIDDDTVALLTAHNVVQKWTISTQTLVFHHPSTDNSILYSGFLLPVADELIILAGTVYSEVIIHRCNGDKNLHNLQGHRKVCSLESVRYHAELRQVCNLQNTRDSFQVVVEGTMGFEYAPGKFHLKKGSLYRIDADGSATKLAQDIDISNGLCWDVTEKAFYYADSFEYTIRRYDYDVDTGNISNPRHIFRYSDHGLEGIVDGMTIDTHGNLWVANFDRHRVLKIDPRSGKLLQKIPIPALQVTSATIGGPDLDTLYVTSACMNRGEEQPPPRGATFQVTGLGVKGHPNSYAKIN